MNQRDVARLKRRLNPERNDPASSTAIIWTIQVGHIPPSPRARQLAPGGERKYMALFKRLLSGAGPELAAHPVHSPPDR